MTVIKCAACLVLVLTLTIHFSSSAETNEKIEEKDEKSTIKPETDVTMRMNSTIVKNRVVDVAETTEKFETIPPTLTNTRPELERNLTAEKSAKVIKESTSLISSSNNLGQIINSRVKQAFINSRQNTFEKLNRTFLTNSDQDAKPAEVSQVSQEIPDKKVPPSTPVQKEFYPSPEVNPIYNYESNFSPATDYTRNGKPDAQFNSHETFKSNWIGGDHHQIGHMQAPLDYVSPPQPRNTNTNIDSNNFNNFPPRLPHSGDRVKFPDDKHQSNEHTWPSTHNNNGDEVVPSLNFKKPKGAWKWIPDEEDETVSPEFYDNVRPTTRDRPYSFESPTNYLYSTSIENRGKPKSGPYPWQVDSVIPTEDYATTLAYNGANKGENLHIHQHRQIPSSPWKRIIHVMTMAVPIGLIISALTPRIVYVHPNASAPVFPILPPPNQQFPPPFNPQQQPFPPSATGQVNGPFPSRQRSIESTSDIVNLSLAQFIKTMETQFKDKHDRNGQKFSGKCEERFFCEVALMGRLPKSEALHRMLYNVALETPDTLATKSGLGEIFTAIKRQNCDVFICKKY